MHCDNDDKSGDEVTASDGRPGIVAQNAADDSQGEGLDTSAEETSHDGKTHLIGDALKSVYQRTLEEDIPDDFLDLLKQLK